VVKGVCPSPGGKGPTHDAKSIKRSEVKINIRKTCSCVKVRKAACRRLFFRRQTCAPPWRPSSQPDPECPEKNVPKISGTSRADTTLDARGPLLALLSARSAQNPLILPFRALYPRRASIATKLIAATNCTLPWSRRIYSSST
jgi:hypothetical protein